MPVIEIVVSGLHPRIVDALARLRRASAGRARLSLVGAARSEDHVVVGLGSRIAPVATIAFGRSFETSSARSATRAALTPAAWLGADFEPWRALAAPLPWSLRRGALDPHRAVVVVDPGVSLDRTSRERLERLVGPHRLHALGLGALGTADVRWPALAGTIGAVLGRAALVVAEPGPLAWDALRLGIPVVDRHLAPLSPPAYDARLAGLVPPSHAASAALYRRVVDLALDGGGSLDVLADLGDDPDSVTSPPAILAKKLRKLRQSPAAFLADSNRPVLRAIGLRLGRARTPEAPSVPSSDLRAPLRVRKTSAQYQSFPDALGDSQTLQKLERLRLPPMAGKRFLDVGCNEGFFSGYAKFDGAAEVVGIDQSSLFVERARARFPECQFLEQGWDRLPDGRFDVILFASSMHYADDQEAMLRSLVEKLAPEGTLVLEVGVVPSQTNEWVKVRRGIDERWFPTRAKLEELLESYAWKHVGPSVSQSGDPVPRQVFHVRARRPFAYLLLAPGSYGKTTIGRRVFARAGVTVVSGDETMRRIARGELAASRVLSSAIAEDYSDLAIDRAVGRVLARGLEEDLIRAFVAQANGQDFALDAFLPESVHAKVQRVVEDAGFLPVTLQWDRPGATLPSLATTESRAHAYYTRLAAASDAATPKPQTSTAATNGTRGYVDEVAVRGPDRVWIRGWAMNRASRAPRFFEVRIHGEPVAIAAMERTHRPDVSAEHRTSDDLVGFELELTLEAPKLAEIVAGLEVRCGDAADQVDAPLTIGSRVVARCP